MPNWPLTKRPAKRSFTALQAPATTDVRATLYGFVCLALGVSLYDGRNGGPDWQAEAMCWFDDPTVRTKATLVTPNGAGKDDRIIGPLAVAYAALHPKATVVIFSKDGTQLDYQTWPSIERFKARLSSQWTWNYRYVESPTGSRIIGRAVDDPKRAEGFHKLDDVRGPLLGVINEAKSIDDEIFEAVDRWTFNGLLYISSPGLMMGRFYESHTKHAAQFAYRKRVPLDQCPHIPEERIRDMIETYGEDHPVVQSSVFANFVNQDDATRFAFPMHEFDACAANPPAHKPGRRFAFCDFAAGGDENVLALADGNRITIEAAWRERDTMSAVNRFLHEFARLGLAAEDIWGDQGSMGVSMMDAMARQGWEINRENFGEAALSDRYYLRAGELWLEAAAAVRRKEIILPDDETARAQMITRKATFETGGRVGVESKKKLAKSPDRGDAVCGAICAYLGKMKTSGFRTLLI